MNAPIAISTFLIAASAGAGFALSAVHRVAFETQSVAALSAPSEVVERDFVIPAYVPVRPATQAPAEVAVAPVDIVPAVVETVAPSDDVVRPRERPDWDIVVTVPHVDDSMLSLAPKAQKNRAVTGQMAFAPLPAPTSNAPMIVTHVAVQDMGVTTLQPDYAHGVYR